MNSLCSRWIALPLLAAFVALPALAQEDTKSTKASVTLKAGDKAPALAVEKWVKGKPVEGFEKGKVYVVEFWATWCGPCIQSMPHLSDLQRQYKDKVTIIGVTTKDSRGNTLDSVEKMVKEKADGMDYTVAWDKDDVTNKAYMEAAKQPGIPTSFVVDAAGKLAWIGHPMFLDIVIEPVLAGKWDATKGAEVVEKAEAAMKDVYENMDSPKKAIAALNKLEKDYPSLAHSLGDMRFGLYLQAGEYATAYKLGNEMVEKAIKTKNSMTLNQVAWTIVDPEGKVEKRDLDLAMKAAQAASDLTDNKDGAILDTLARVYFVKGDKEKAIEIQKKAIENADGRMKRELEATLKEYQGGAKPE